MLIGFAGRKGAGKDTAAQVLIDMGADHVKMAGALKSMIVGLLINQGLPPCVALRMTDGDLKEVPSEYLNGKTPRWAMQSLGTEWGRELIGDDFWINVTKRRILSSPAQYVVVSDVRFPNEVQAIKDLGGKVYRVERAGTANDNHPSEALIDTLDVDGVIRNSAPTPAAFQMQVALMFN